MHGKVLLQAPVLYGIRDTEATPRKSPRHRDGPHCSKEIEECSSASASSPASPSKRAPFAPSAPSASYAPSAPSAPSAPVAVLDKRELSLSDEEGNHSYMHIAYDVLTGVMIDVKKENIC